MAEEKEREMVCIAGIAGSADHTPGHQRSGPAGENTRRLVNGGRKPLS
jgi:hypothetical protein